MSGLDYSTFSLCSALTPSQPPSYPADSIQQHAAGDVIDSHIMQRDDLPSSCSSTASDHPRDGAPTLYGHHGQGSSTRSLAFPRSSLPTDSVDDTQGNSLCARLGGFHFTPQYRGHGYTTVDEPTAIIENAPSWSSHHSLRYPTPVRGFMSQRMTGPGAIPEDARMVPHPDVSPRVSDCRVSTATSDRQLGRTYDFAAPSSSSAMDVTAFFPGGLITSPSPPPTAYHDDDFSGGECGPSYAYADQLPAMTHTTAHEPATHYSLDRHTAPSLGGIQEAAHQAIMPLDHRYATTMATPFPGHPSSQSPHDHPISDPPSFGTAMDAEELPRPGSAPPLIDSQVFFVGDVRAALQHAQQSVSGDHQQSWYPQPASPSTGQSPRSSPRRAGSIGHNAQKTPQGSRHLRRWSSVTNPALRGSPPFPSPFSPNVIPFPRYPPSASDNATNPSNSPFSPFSPSVESESDDMSAYALPHAAVVDVSEPAGASDPLSASQQQQQQLTMRNVIRCDGHRVDEESWSAALARPDKQLHVFECFWDLAHKPCGMWIEGDQSSVADHLALFHGFRGGEVTTRCLWRDCPKPHMKGTSIARHVVTHIGFRVKCHTCKHEFARVDACNRAHSRSGCLGVGQPMYGELQRVLDACKVDPLQRPSKKRRTDE